MERKIETDRGLGGGRKIERETTRGELRQLEHEQQPPGPVGS